MRWLYIDPTDAHARRSKQATIESIDRWWLAFSANAKDIAAHFDRKDFEFPDLPGWMQEHLGTVSPDLCWEFGPPVNGTGHRLVFSVESHTELRPMVDTLLERAPAVPGWEFFPYRVPESADWAIATVKGRVGVDFSAARVRAQRSPDGRLDLVFATPDYSEEAERTLRSAAFVATQSLIGEELLDAWIDCIDVVSLDDSGRDDRGLPFLPLDRLNETVRAAIDAATEQLPAAPVWQSPPSVSDAGEAMWACLEREAPVRDDYARWSDLYVAVTMHVPLWQAAHNTGFFSRRFSRIGETICYLKIDGRNGLNPDHFGDRGDVEDALTAALEPGDLGGVWGGGTGRIYSYIELSLTDVVAAIPVIRRVLRAGDIPLRAWLLFYDSYLSGEWVGIWDHTPPPPQSTPEE